MVCLRYVAALTVVGLGVGWFAVPSAAQSGETYKTRLSALPADARTRADLAGTGTVTATLSGTKLTVNGTFEGLKTNAVSAKLQNGIVAGVRGPAFADLTITKGDERHHQRIGRSESARTAEFEKGRNLRPDLHGKTHGRHSVGLAATLGDARPMKKLLIPVSLFAALYGVLQLPGQQGAAGPFTAQQADEGRTAYQANCAGCHAADLSGIGNALPLAGLPFTGSWGNRTVGDLVGFMEGAMPPNNPGGLGDQNYLNIAAFILQSNGARAGNQALTGNSTVAIRSVATGQVVAQIQGGQGKQGKQGGQARRPWSPAASASRADHPGNGEELHADHRRDDAQSRPGGLADDPARLSRQQLQHAEPDHREQRAGSAPGVDLGHE